MVAWLVFTPVDCDRNGHVHEFTPTYAQRLAARRAFYALGDEVLVFFRKEIEEEIGHLEEPFGIK